MCVYGMKHINIKKFYRNYIFFKKNYKLEGFSDLRNSTKFYKILQNSTKS
jgi:hypothetical protein